MTRPVDIWISLLSICFVIFISWFECGRVFRARVLNQESAAISEKLHWPFLSPEISCQLSNDFPTWMPLLLKPRTHSAEMQACGPGPCLFLQINTREFNRGELKKRGLAPHKFTLLCNKTIDLHFWTEKTKIYPLLSFNERPNPKFFVISAVSWFHIRLNGLLELWWAVPLKPLIKSWLWNDNNHWFLFISLNNII